MSDSDNDPKGKGSDSSSIDSKMSDTVGIFCTCDLSSCQRFWCNFNSYWRLLILFLAVVLYLVFGALIFSAVEGPNEQRQIQMVQQARQDAFDNLTETILNLSNLTLEEAQNVTLAIIELGETASKTIPAEQNPMWDYSSAFFFSSTVITTIGYGTIFPTTAAGQIIFIFYALIGIPLALVFLSRIGSIIDKFIHTSLRPVKRRYGATAARVIGLVALFLVTIVFFVLIPAAIFTAIEVWNYRESVYYAVVSLTTVGFGDFVPAFAGIRSSSIVTRLYKFISTAWLWIGLAMVSALISEFQSLFEALGKLVRTQNCYSCVKRKIEDKSELKIFQVEAASGNTNAAINETDNEE